MFILTLEMNTVKHGRMNRNVGQHHGDLRSALLTAAMELVAESDAEGVTLRAVARRAGVSAAAPYHHFPDKDALLAAIARDGFDALGTAQRAVLGGAGSAPDRLERLVTEYVVFALRHRTHYGVMIRALSAAIGGDEGGALRASAARTFGLLVDAVAAAAPRLDFDEATNSAVLAWAFAHGAAEVGRWGPALQPGLDPEVMAAEVGCEVRRMVVGR